MHAAISIMYLNVTGGDKATWKRGMAPTTVCWRRKGRGGGQLQHGVASVWVLLIIDGGYVFSSLVITQINDDAWYGAGREFFFSANRDGNNSMGRKGVLSLRP